MLSCDCTRYIAVFDWLENLGRQESSSYKLVSYWPVEISAIPGFFYDFSEIRRPLFIHRTILRDFILVSASNEAFCLFCKLLEQEKNSGGGYGLGTFK